MHSRSEPRRTAKGPEKEHPQAVADHAEMAALMSCARSGGSPVDGTLYCTTFRCHNCAKHIVAAGIRSVVYVEPYPKSKAKDLYAATPIRRLAAE